MGKVMMYVLKVVGCCIWCFEKLVKFLNKNAYIQIAILGKPFCTSAKNAFFFILVATAVVGYFILQAIHPEVNPILPVLSYLAVGYIVAKLYMNVFGLAVDTMLQCFIATEEMGGDSGFVPAQLQSLLPSKERDAA